MWYGSLMVSIARQDEFIRSLGVEAYRVGGSVRDEILGRTPKDADYIVRGVSLDNLAWCIRDAEGARPKPLVDRQGQQFGWRTAKQGIEISLPRTEWNDGSGRRMGIRVDPRISLAVDAQRRDFTFNALYKPITVPFSERARMDTYGVRDPTGTGLHDLQHRIIRTTHPDSFRDDPLRMLRALRFLSTLDADLAETTRMEMFNHAGRAGELTHKGFTSGTVFDEFSKLLMGQKPGTALRESVLTGVLPHAMPELAEMIGFEQGSRYHDLTTDEHTFVAIDTAAHVDAPLRVRWALLFHDAGKPESAWVGIDGNRHYYATTGAYNQGKYGIAGPQVPEYGEVPKDLFIDTEDHEAISERLWRAAAKRMGVERRFTDDVATIIREHMVSIKTRAPSVKVARMRVKLGDELLRDLYLHRMCDLSGKGSGKVAQDQIRHIAMLEGTRVGQQQAKVPTSVKDLAIGGEDVKHLEGRERGEALRRVLDEVVCDPTTKKLHREWQLSRI